MQHLHTRALITPWGREEGDAAAWAFDVPEERWRDGEMVLGVAALLPWGVCAEGAPVMSPQEPKGGGCAGQAQA